MRQPDIEIYLKDADHIAIANWLGEALGPCSPWQQKGQTFKCRAGNIPVVWLPKAVERFVGVRFPRITFRLRSALL